jgi:hypothetical protein
MDIDPLEDLLRRLTALVVKLDSTYDELKEFNRQQVQINARLETLMTRVFAEHHNGHEG